MVVDSLPPPAPLVFVSQVPRVTALALSRANMNLNDIRETLDLRPVSENLQISANLVLIFKKEKMLHNSRFG